MERRAPFLGIEGTPFISAIRFWISGLFRYVQRLPWVGVVFETPGLPSKRAFEQAFAMARFREFLLFRDILFLLVDDMLIITLTKDH